jgi:signal transduction histidine kinase
MANNTPEILAVFKEDENMKAAVELLAKKGYNVFSETSMFLAIATLAERKVDVIILDIDDLELKEMEFFDVVRKFNPNLSILISCSFINRDKAVKSLEGGADSYILKPFYINELLVVVRKFSNGKNHKEDILKESKATRESIEKQSSMERMALTIAHEINNPLTIISGQLQLLLSEMESNAPNYSVYVTLEEETQRIAQAVRNLVAYTQMKEPNKAFVNLNDILKDAIYFFKDTRQGRDIQVIETFDWDLPTVMADKKQITLVCKNIICNSKRAVDSNGVLNISTERDRHNVTVTFCDPGKEIPFRVIDKVFDPLLAENEVERKMGLGLCVSHKIIKKHGGDLAVKNLEDKGTAFRFTLPIENI